MTSYRSTIAKSDRGNVHLSKESDDGTLTPLCRAKAIQKPVAVGSTEPLIAALEQYDKGTQTMAQRIPLSQAWRCNRCWNVGNNRAWK